MIKAFVEIDHDRCKGCELCVVACPPKVACLIMSNDLKENEPSPNTNSKGYHFAVQFQENCIGCSNCAIVCPDSCITVYKLAK